MGTEQHSAPAAAGRRWLLGRHHWSDWAGFAFFGAALLWGASKKSGVSIYALPLFTLEFLKAASFLIRGPATRTLSGVEPRIAAYGTTFLVPGFLLTAGRWAPHLTNPVASPVLRSAGWVFGTAALVLGIIPTWYLRHSFSIEPAARGLVTTGPYRFARHPIYSTYLLANAAIWVSAPRIALSLVLGLWFALLWVRVGYEERVLTLAFPDYVDYQKRVGMFGPKLRRTDRA